MNNSNNAMNTWTQHIQGICGEFQTRFDRQSSLFIGEVNSFLLGQTEIAFIKSNASFIERKPEILDRAKDRFCFLILQYTGKMLMKYRSENIYLNEGDIVLLDSNEHIAMYPQGLFSHISVHLSREKLFKQGIITDHFGKLISQNMSAHLLKNMLQTMSSDNIEFWYAEEDGNAFEDALIALIKPTVNYKNVQICDSLKLKAERYILENLMQSNLSPKVVADHIGVSLRHLYRLFMVDQQSMASDLTRVSLELGGKAQEGTGYFVEPTLLKVSGVDDPLFIEETFGPVVDVIPFETDEELIEMMNHSRFGLTASLWTNDLSKALRLIPQIDAGSIWINMHTFLDPAVPFGGVKASGVGREFSDAFIEDYTEVKSVMIRY